MHFILSILIGTLLSWIALVAAFHLARTFPKLFSLPALEDVLGRLALVALAANLLGVLLGFLGWYTGAVLCWLAIYWWLGVPFWDALILSLVSWFARTVLLGRILALLFSA